MSGRGHAIVVDDDHAARRMMRRLLERHGWDVAEAANGADGLELVRSARPDVAVLDLRMPGELSGLDVVRKVRCDADLDGIRVVIVTASASSDARSQAIEAGCDAFLDKPVDFDELYDTLDRLVPDRR